MRLVYAKGNTREGEEVKPKDRVLIDGTYWQVDSIEKPHKPESTGRVHLALRRAGLTTEYATYFPSVIDAEWVDREDHAELDRQDKRLERIHGFAKAIRRRYVEGSGMRLNAYDAGLLHEMAVFVDEGP
jgi:hypothetical protein